MQLYRQNEVMEANMARWNGLAEFSLRVRLVDVTIIKATYLSTET
jgi:hypothetical protein